MYFVSFSDIFNSFIYFEQKFVSIHHYLITLIFYHITSNSEVMGKYAV